MNLKQTNIKGYSKKTKKKERLCKEKKEKKTYKQLNYLQMKPVLRSSNWFVSNNFPQNVSIDLYLFNNYLKLLIFIVHTCTAIFWTWLVHFVYTVAILKPQLFFVQYIDKMSDLLL